MPTIYKAILCTFVLLAPLPALSQQPLEPGAVVVINETFSDLRNWRPLSFPKIPRSSTYTVEKLGAELDVLKASSNNSASALRYQKEFNVAQVPILTFRWRVDSVYQKGDGRKKAGDDFPLRISVAFKYDPDKASFALRTKYGAAKMLHGEYPPHSSIAYVWGNQTPVSTVITSPYTDRAKAIVLDSGKAHLGQWREHSVNILEDYERAFGAKPPTEASLAIMNDSDNTGESSVSYVDYILLKAR